MISLVSQVKGLGSDSTVSTTWPSAANLTRSTSATEVTSTSTSAGEIGVSTIGSATVRTKVISFVAGFVGHADGHGTLAQIDASSLPDVGEIPRGHDPQQVAVHQIVHLRHVARCLDLGFQHRQTTDGIAVVETWHPQP